MGQVSKVIPSLHNGISQQPSILRLDTQCEDVLNGFATLVDGMGKRPPTEHLAVLSSNASVDSFTHVINRDSSEQYVVIATGDAEEPLEIYQLPSGEKCSVQLGYFDAADVFHGDPLMTDYLTSTGGVTPLRAFKATTVADYTIITNSTKTCAMKSDVSTPLPNEAVIYIKKGVAGTSYSININGTLVTYASGDTTQYDTYRSTTVASSLYASLVAAFPAPTWTISVSGSAIKVKRADGADFNITVFDSWGDQATQLIKGSCQRFTDLPAVCFDGTRVQITGEPTTSLDNYWVEYQTASGSKTGVWQETVAPGIKNTMDPTTLPHKLIRSGVKQFQFGSLVWEDRKVGDYTTAPAPSLIGNVVNDVFFYRNRLGFLAGENIVLSKAGNFFNFWPSTVTEVLDDDPIDVAVATNEVSTLYNAIPFNTSLLAFGDQQQFQISSGDQRTTAKTIQADPTTHFPAGKYCKPVSAGSNVYFTSPRGNNAAMREYFVQPGSLTNDAADVSAHVPRLLPQEVIKLTASSGLDVVVGLGATDRNFLYVYKYFWNGDEKAQSAWFRWAFDGIVVGCELLDTYLYLLILRGSQVCLERVRMEKAVTGSLPYRVHLDRRVSLTGVFDQGTGNTTWTLPYLEDSPASAFSIIKSTDGNPIHVFTKPSDNTIVAPGDFSAYPCYIGIRYTFRHRFSEWHLKAPNTNVAVQQGRLLIRTLTITFTDTGYFRLEVTPEGRTTKQAPFNAVILGQYYIGEPTLYSMTKRFDIIAKAENTIIELVNDSHLPSEFHSGAFEGTFIGRNQAL